jgi:serine/threonine-protein kinase
MASEGSIVWNKEGEERIPRPFGRLWLLRRLARGGMGEVYLAATSGIEGAERPCVVKIIRRDHATDKSFLARFFDEARVQAQLQHHGVAQVVEASTDTTGEPYVVVEYVEGRSLGEVRARATHAGVAIEWADAVALGLSAAEALAHVHERTDGTGKALGIVHRDLSPQNIMIGYGGDLKLIDFGTARAENRRCHTISGVVFAKPGYVAPEVAAGTSGDARVDLYALGIILWELLAGRRFLEGDPTEHLALVAKDERKPPPIAKQVGAPLRLDDVIAKLTAHKLTDRYETAHQVAADLVKLLATCAPLPTGERGVRARTAYLMKRLYPSEPAKSRAEFDSLVKAARWAGSEDSPAPSTVADAHAKSPAPSSAPALQTSRSPLPPPRSPLQSITDGDPNVLVGTRYRILGTIGSGAMGTVYEAQHVDLLRRVALKVLSQDRAMITDVAAFRREAQAIATVLHPNLVMIHDFGESADGRPYCAMELLDGQTLEQRLIQDTRLDWREAAKIGVAACRGLEAAHAVGVVHCDLKPANLFLSKGPTGQPGELKILDFGIARRVSEGHAPVEGETHFAIAGTPEYMAPEQARSGSAIDARADVYALGCVLYEICTGRRPFVASSAVALIEMKTKSAPEPMRVRSRAIGVPPALDRIVLKALSPKPGDRYANAEELRLVLEEILRAPRRRRTVSRAAGYGAIAGAGFFALSAFGVMELKPERAGLPSRSVLVARAADGALRAADYVHREALTLLGAPEMPAATPVVAAREWSADELGDVVARVTAAQDGPEPSAATSATEPVTPDAPVVVNLDAPEFQANHPAAPSHERNERVATSDSPAFPDRAAIRTLPSFGGAAAGVAPAAVAVTSSGATLALHHAATAGSANAAPHVVVAAAAGAAVVTPHGNTAQTSAHVASGGPAGAASAGSASAPSHPLGPAKDAKDAKEGVAVAAARGTDTVVAGLHAGAAALQDGLTSQALVIHRDLAERHPRNARVLRAWAESAAAAQEWKEAAQAAETWSLADAGIEPRLFYARMLGYGGKPKAARRMLEDLLEAHPACDEARALLADLRAGQGGPSRSAAARAEHAQTPVTNDENSRRP